MRKTTKKSYIHIYVSFQIIFIIIIILNEIKKITIINI